MLVILGAAAVILGLSTVAPAFAWTSSLTTTIYCNNSGTWSACTQTQLKGLTTSIEDKATVTLTSDGSPYGTVSFYVYSGGSNTYTNAQHTGYNTCTLGTSANAPSLVWTDSKNAQTVTGSGSTTYTSSSPSFSHAAGSFFFYVVYNGAGTNGYPSSSTCEPFTTTTPTFPPPPTGVPQFPFGTVALLALAIPAMLLVRSKFGSNNSSTHADI
jgi:hypothetical protein